MSHQHNRAWIGSVRCAVGIAAVAIVGFGAGGAKAQSLNQVGVARLNESLDCSVALSDGDVLTFRAAGTAGTGMYALQPSQPPATGGGLLTIRGVDFASPQLSPPSMNSSGAMCFTDLDVDGRSAIFARGPGGTIITIRGENFGSFAGASMGGGFTGTIYGDHRTATGAALLALQPGGSTITIVGEDFGATGFSRARSSSSSSTPIRTFVLVDSFPQNGVNAPGVLCVGDGGSIITIVGRDRFDNIRGPAVSTDTVVFTGLETSSGLGGVFAAAPGGDILTIHGENFLSPPDFSEPAANDAGAIVFARLGASNGGVERIYYTDMFGSPLQTLAELGDELLGSTIVGLSFNADGLNQAGDFAYSAQLADGTTAIMIASGVPAPGAACLLGMGALTAMRRKRR